MFSKQPITYVALDEVTNQVKPTDRRYKTVMKVKGLSTEINFSKEVDSLYMLEDNITNFVNARSQ